MFNFGVAMGDAKNDIVAEFTKEIIRVNLAFRQYIQAKLRNNNIDLTFEMLQVLGTLWTTDGINQQEIANITVKDKASMTYLIDNLTKRKLVYRQEDGNDRRNKIIYLTEPGKQMQLLIQPWLHEMHAFAGCDMPVEMITDCMKVLEKFRENLRPEGDPVTSITIKDNVQ